MRCGFCKSYSSYIRQVSLTIGLSWLARLLKKFQFVPYILEIFQPVQYKNALGLTVNNMSDSPFLSFWIHSVYFESVFQSIPNPGCGNVPLTYSHKTFFFKIEFSRYQNYWHSKNPKTLTKHTLLRWIHFLKLVGESNTSRIAGIAWKRRCVARGL